MIIIVISAKACEEMYTYFIFDSIFDSSSLSVAAASYFGADFSVSNVV